MEKNGMLLGGKKVPKHLQNAGQKFGMIQRNI
jgi:hypothetical protein